MDGNGSSSRCPRSQSFIISICSTGAEGENAEQSAGRRKPNGKPPVLAGKAIDIGEWCLRFGLALLLRGLSVLLQYRVTLERTLYLQQGVLHLHFPSPYRFDVTTREVNAPCYRPRPYLRIELCRKDHRELAGLRQNLSTLSGGGSVARGLSSGPRRGHCLDGLVIRRLAIVRDPDCPASTAPGGCLECNVLHSPELKCSNAKLEDEDRWSIPAR